jgi:hypothetical protein
MQALLCRNLESDRLYPRRRLHEEPPLLDGKGPSSPATGNEMVATNSQRNAVQKSAIERSHFRRKEYDHRDPLISVVQGREAGCNRARGGY